MLSSVLQSQRAIQVNIEIMRAFVKLRELIASNKDLAKRLDDLEKKYDSQFKVVFDAIRELMTPTPPCPDCPGEGVGSIGLANILSTGGFIDPRALTGQTYPAVFFPGTTDRAEAGSVKVTAGAQVDGIDMRLVVR